MIDKPDWKDAPEWARYLAQDKDGEWIWFEYEPIKEVEGWGLSRFVGKSESAHKEAWTLTLEERP